MPPQNNQYKTPPAIEVNQLVRERFALGDGDKAIAQYICQLYQNQGYSISAKTIQRRRKALGLQNAYDQKQTAQTIIPAYEELREMYPTQGARMLREFMRNDHGIHVSVKKVAECLRENEPEEVERRKGRKLQHRRIYIAGVNVSWSMDQHDKWRKYGLYLHTCVEVCSGYILWMKVWWTNRNPRVICSYYLDAVRERGGIPLLTQSDPGTENFGVAKAQTLIRHTLDPSLTGTIQHRWTKMNTPAEIIWSGLRRSWSHGFENLFERGVNEGLYDTHNVTQRLLFQWLAIPWIQSELDKYVYVINRSRKRSDRFKANPTAARPLDVLTQPPQFSKNDYKIVVSNDDIELARDHYANPSDPGFIFTDPEFDILAQCTYLMIGKPEVVSGSFWTIYQNMLEIINGEEQAHKDFLAPDLYDINGIQDIDDIGVDSNGNILQPPQIDVGEISIQQQGTKDPVSKRVFHASSNKEGGEDFWIPYLVGEEDLPDLAQSSDDDSDSNE